MAPLKRHDTTTLTTSDQEVPVATSDPLDYAPPLRRSSRVSCSSYASSSSSRRPSVPPRRSPRIPTTVQTTPARPPPRSHKGKGKGKGLHGRHESVSDDPNLSPYRHPSYKAPQLGAASSAVCIPTTRAANAPFLQTTPTTRSVASPDFTVLDERHPLAQLPAPPAQEEDVGDDDDDFDVQLPFTTENGLVYDYPPPDPEDPFWFEDMHGNIEADYYIKQLLKDVKAAVSAKLYQSTIIELELEDLVKNYDKMLGDIGRMNGRKFEMFLRREAGLTVVPGLNEEGVVHLRRSPPRPQPQPQPQPGRADENVFDAPNVLNGAPAEQQVEEADPELVPTEPVEHRSSSPISSPSNGASFRAQKRRLEAASSIEDVFITFPTNKRRRVTPGPTLRYSPLPPSSPLPSTHASSSESGSPRPAPVRLSPIAEAEAASETGVVDSDPDWVPNDSNAENIDPNGNVVNEVADDVQKDKVTPLRNAWIPRSTPPEVVCARIEAIHPYYVPPRSSDLDIPMAWPPRSDEVVEEQDKEKETKHEADEKAGAGEGEASTSFGHSVSAALARAKDKGKAPAREDPLAAAAAEFWATNISPGAGTLLPFRKYTREEEDMLWPPYNSNLIS
ncbi:hypothetical protein C8T65DRAFT_729020 [Cerioporus squamosus]|nr:hypothetical protein C8T65DRAFT_729020 [Cerioporus squamosus]